ncbi:MAG: type II secretion system F family protein [Paraburkholderia sp.]|uniref:type II secretion system F family protein n=1 Tax=Paraburkholderia sp. TaxID=1926495 RepID=UPI0011F491B2|nr:type II secretion system F family protein [Paraburkholderia sp.]TAM03566.1 MAG: type II secretion system F family protein [Paraburkholderia sp.]TAM32160.1 MAG: type II secretion system F family protein [Paraburkholderia sp.]
MSAQAFDVRLLVDGKLVERVVHGCDEADVRAQLGASSGIVLKIGRRARFGAGRKAPAFALTLFLQELSTLLDAGLVLIEALEALRDKAGADRGSKPVLDRVVAVMVEGQPFSKALAKQPDVFPALLVATIESAEGSGQLPVVLKRYLQYETRIAQIRKRVTGALVYPALVIGIGCAILMFMAFFVIPRFATVFETMNTLPATARAMLAWSNLLAKHGGAIGVALAVAAALAVGAIRGGAARRLGARLMWRVPKVRDIAGLFALTRFYRTTGLLIEGGTPALGALDLAGKTLPAPHRARLHAALVELRAGRTVSAVLAQHALTTPVAERLLRVGEQSGDLGGMCEHIAQFHDSALDRAIEMASKVFEPVLMLVVGGIVGAVVVLLYMPIFELAGSIG